MSSLSPIAVFDSGIGGLTVLKSLAEAFPCESFLYLGDTARLPYGTKSRQTIYNYANQNFEYFKNLNVKAIVVACNSASSAIAGQNEYKGIPVYEVIQPGAHSALRVTKNNTIAVLGTRATVSSKAYENAITKLHPNTNVISLACPLFVPLAEEGLSDDPLTNLVAYRYLSPILASGFDTLILGCTHYPILQESIRKVVGKDIHIVSSGRALVEKLKHDFENEKLLVNKAPEPVIRIQVTDDNHNMARLLKIVLGDNPKITPEVVHIGG